MLNSRITKKINKKHCIYTKRAFICNLKSVVDYCIYTNNSSSLYLYMDRYKFYAKKFHINLNKYKIQIYQGINKCQKK